MSGLMIYGGSMNADRVNLSFYRFYRVGDMEALRALKIHLLAFCIKLQLKGTLLIAPEGVNAMISGSRDSIDTFKEFARETLGISDSVFKEAPIIEDSFKRMLVKIKKEIITVGDSELRPEEQTAKRLSPAELKKWLDERKPMVLLDTRNRYEVEVGTFEGALELGMDSSRQFARKSAERLAEWKDLPVVTFCTGGIRCEKASALLLKSGLSDVYQLDGGILRYFKENGSEHFNGNCFVFDWRLAVDGELKPVVRSPDPEQEFGRHISQAGDAEDPIPAVRPTANSAAADPATQNLA